MPASYFLDQTRHAVFVRSWGRLTDADVEGVVRALYSDIRFDDSYALLQDYRAITLFELSPGAVRIAASYIAAKRHLRRAVVVGSDVVFGMTRMLQLFSDASPEHFTVYHDLESAMDWVGLDNLGGWPPDTPDYSTSNTSG